MQVRVVDASALTLAPERKVGAPGILTRIITEADKLRVGQALVIPASESKKYWIFNLRKRLRDKPLSVRKTASGDIAIIAVQPAQVQVQAPAHKRK